MLFVNFIPIQVTNQNEKEYTFLTLKGNVENTNETGLFNHIFIRGMYWNIIRDQ